MFMDGNFGAGRPRFSEELVIRFLTEASTLHARDDVIKKRTAAVESAAKFLIADTKRYPGGGGDAIKEPIVRESAKIAMASSDITKHTAFQLSRTKEVVREMLVANATTHALYELSAAKVVSWSVLTAIEDLIFDVAAERVVLELYARKAMGEEAPVMTLKEAVHHAYPSKRAAKTRQHDMRDFLTANAIVGLVKGTYNHGNGYTFRPGPLLIELHKTAVEPALVHFNAY